MIPVHGGLYKSFHTPTIPIINVLDSIETRFVRITVSGAEVYTGQWVSLTELRVFGNKIVSNENVPADTEILISPNPATSIVTIQGAEAYDMVSVYDQIGRRVFQKQIKNASSLDVSELQSGIYVLKFEGGGKSFVSKLIKK